MEVLFLTVFVSLLLSFVAVLFFVRLVGDHTLDENDRIALLPIEAGVIETSATQTNTSGLQEENQSNAVARRKE